MLPKGSIEARHIWKRFRAEKRSARLRDSLDRRQLDGRFGDKGRRRGYRWALRDIDLIAQPGESIGLVGANGSGKSTFLKILCRVMYPYAGTVEVEGRVGALIEVRAGIHPELTGRENIHLYGSLLGLPRSHVNSRFADIIDFAEIPEAVDRQVKFYSSGMQMRLGFAVAAFLEPDLLLVDEVLAVGDASFQQKCLDRMRYVLNQGTTLIYVSHDLATVEATCDRVLWLDRGVLRADGPGRDVLNLYRGSVESIAEGMESVDGELRLVKAEVEGPDRGAPTTNEPLDIRLVIESPEYKRGAVVLGITEGTASPIILVKRQHEFSAGLNEVRCQLERLPLPMGRYFLWAGVFERRNQDVLPWHPVAKFDVVGSQLDKAPSAIVRLAPVFVPATWGEGAAPN